MAEPDASTPREIKKALRRRILALRDGIDTQERARVSKVVFGRLLALPEYGAARAVSCYAGFGSELDTLPVLQRILDDGKLLAMSLVDRQARELSLYWVESLQAQLQPGIWGILEPNPQSCPPCAPQELDLIIMPGAVFDVHCGRIGYGAGYYDRLLSRLQPLPYLVAGAFDLQVVDEVPMEAHDVRLDRIFTETREFTYPRQQGRD
jgi:5-formyltetrahydrofolate cyclo-ligase